MPGPRVVATAVVGLRRNNKTGNPNEKQPNHPCNSQKPCTPKKTPSSLDLEKIRPAKQGIDAIVHTSQHVVDACDLLHRTEDRTVHQVTLLSLLPLRLLPDPEAASL
jgi:hypothetical protein